MKDDKYVEEKAQEAHKKFALKHYDFHGIWIKDMEDFILSIIKDYQPKVSREWVYYFCAYINAGHKSPADDKARVEHAIKKLKEQGVEVER